MFLYNVFFLKLCLQTVKEGSAFFGPLKQKTSL